MSTELRVGVKQPSVVRCTILAMSVVVVSSSTYGAARMIRMAENQTMSMRGGEASQPVSGMPLSEMPEMFLGLAAFLVVAAVVVAGRGAHARSTITAHPRVQIAVCTLALCVDVSKTSTLGFVIPGMRSEYGLAPTTAALLATAGLAGTMLGALCTRAMAGRIGNRDVYMLATLAFTVTSACGGMPNFAGNLIMCFFMGISVGTLAPTLVTTIRGLSIDGSAIPVVVTSVLAGAGGYFLAAGTAAWLTPVFGWRVMWLVGAPTGAILLALTPFIGDRAEATGPVTRERVPVRGRDLVLRNTYATFTGIASFSIITWAPTLILGAKISGQQLTIVSLLMVLAAGFLAMAYRRVGDATTTAITVGLTGVSIGGLLVAAGTGSRAGMASVALISALLGVSAMAAMLLPSAANSVDAHERLRTVASVSAYNRLGGLVGPLALAPLITSRPLVFVAVAVLASACILLSQLMSRTEIRQTGAVPSRTRDHHTRSPIISRPPPPE